MPGHPFYIVEKALADKDLEDMLDKVLQNTGDQLFSEPELQKWNSRQQAEPRSDDPVKLLETYIRRKIITPLSKENDSDISFRIKNRVRDGIYGKTEVIEKGNYEIEIKKRKSGAIQGPALFKDVEKQFQVPLSKILKTSFEEVAHVCQFIHLGRYFKDDSEIYNRICSRINHHHSTIKSPDPLVDALGGETIQKFERPARKFARKAIVRRVDFEKDLTDLHLQKMAEKYGARPWTTACEVVDRLQKDGLKSVVTRFGWTGKVKAFVRWVDDHYQKIDRPLAKFVIDRQEKRLRDCDPRLAKETLDNEEPAEKTFLLRGAEYRLILSPLVERNYIKDQNSIKEIICLVIENDSLGAEVVPSPINIGRS